MISTKIVVKSIVESWKNPWVINYALYLSIVSLNIYFILKTYLHSMIFLLDSNFL